MTRISMDCSVVHSYRRRKKMKKYLYILAILVVVFSLSASAFAQLNNEGTSAATFLKIGVGARAQGMGSAFVAQANDIFALYYNPSGIVHIDGRQVAFSQVDWVSDIQMQYFAVALPIGLEGKIGVAITNLTMGEMKVTNWEFPDGTGQTFAASNMALGVTYARRITDHFSLGITAKYIEEKISQSSATGYAVDIGTQYTTGFNGMRIGMALTNFGSKLTMRGQDLNTRVDPYPTEGSNPDDVWADLTTVAWPLPMTFRMGLSMDFVKSDFLRVTGNVDFNKERDYKQRYFGGVELGFMNEMVFLRGGINTRYDNETIACFGAGLHYKISDKYALVVDYAYADLGRLENANRFSFAFAF